MELSRVRTNPETGRVGVQTRVPSRSESRRGVPGQAHADHSLSPSLLGTEFFHMR